MSSDGTGVLEFQSSGFELYLPPTAFKAHFVMLDETKKIFYGIDYETATLGNRTRWSRVSPENVQDPAIVFPPEQCDKLENERSAIGFLVSISRRNGDRFIAQKLGRVEVQLLEERQMNWSALINMKREELPNEMRAGLMEHLWNRRPNSMVQPIKYVTPGSVLDQMPRKWHLDGVALNYELDGMFASGVPLDSSQHWEVHGAEDDQIELLKAQARDRVVSQ